MKRLLAANKKASYKGGMMTTSDQLIFSSALSLPPAVRAQLAESLLDSLETNVDRAAIDAAWKEEIVRRVEALDRGETETVPAEEVISELRSRVRS
jgi:putative addiction module component (TIGR02574 family)